MAMEIYIYRDDGVVFNITTRCHDPEHTTERKSSVKCQPSRHGMARHHSQHTVLAGVSTFVLS